jgi:hypothetical protein
MKKKLLLLLALVLLCEVPQAVARGRYGGGARYSGARTTTRSVSHTSVTRTRSVGAYRPPAGTYHSGAYATSAGTARRTSRRVTRRQVGYRTGYLQAGYSTYYVDGDPYYYSEGTYYTDDDDGYIAVKAPLGATLPTLPLGATLVEGKTNVYVADGVYYRPAYENGAVVYVVSNP